MLELVDVPDPVPGPGQVLVKASSIGVNYFDLLIRTGRYRWMPALPFILGNEMSGRVARARQRREQAQGRPARCSSPATRSATAAGSTRNTPRCRRTRRGRCPDSIGDDEATALTNYQLAHILLHHAARGVKAGDRRGLWRGGGVGSALIDVARHAGAERDRHRGIGREMRVRPQARRGACDQLPTRRTWSSGSMR